ncbi:MAG: hypothetical protein GC192_15325 [Bacteroidetes bacterium]|nr:hypothetical protein [Bacteroidota bacterium]
MKFNNCISRSKQVLVFLTFITTTLASIYSSHAQSAIGVQFGKCYSKFDVVEGSVKFYDFSEEFDHKSPIVKTFYSYFPIKQLGIKQSIGYEKRGVIIKNDPGWVGYTKFSLNYLHLSTSLNLRPIKYLNIHCGLNYNYLVKAVGYYGRDGSGETTEHYSKFDIGYDIGSAIIIKGVFIEGSIFKSIKPIRSFGFSVFDPNLKDTEYRNNSYEISIGYQVEINKIIKKKKK